jgi:hypothetical protein
MRLSPLLLSLSSLAVLTACTFSLPDSTHRTGYEAGGAAGAAPAGSAARDLETCRRAADREMGPESAIDPADDFTANPMVLARREQLRSKYQTLVDQCMGTPRQ